MNVMTLKKISKQKVIVGKWRLCIFLLVDLFPQLSWGNNRTHCAYIYYVVIILKNIYKFSMDSMTASPGGGPHLSMNCEFSKATIWIVNSQFCISNALTVYNVAIIPGKKFSALIYWRCTIRSSRIARLDFQRNGQAQSWQWSSPAIYEVVLSATWAQAATVSFVRVNEHVLKPDIKKKGCLLNSPSWFIILILNYPRKLYLFGCQVKFRPLRCLRHL